MKQCIRCWVSGRVQGVWYRAFAQEKARELGISGYAKNLPDGRVEVLACGSDNALEKLRQWLWQGPSHAKVDHVHWEPVAKENCEEEFYII
jgi:acylphosphatase